MVTHILLLSLQKEDFIPGVVVDVVSSGTQIPSACQRMKMVAHTSQCQKWSKLSKIKMLRKCPVAKHTLSLFYDQVIFTLGVLELVVSLAIQIHKLSQLMRMVTHINQSLDVLMHWNNTNWSMQVVVMFILWFWRILEKFIALEEVLVVN